MGRTFGALRALLLAGALTGSAIALAQGVASDGTDAATTAPPVELPQNRDVLFWTQDQRDLAFRMLDAPVPSARIAHDPGQVRPLPAGTPLDVRWHYDNSDWSIDAYMADQRLAGLIIVQDGRVRVERYGLGFTAEGRWTSFSVAKSFTSTLVGAAIRDGAIQSINDPVTRYIPELAGSGYDGVTIAQLLAMQSGVRWNEDYTDPQSDVARFMAQRPEGDVDAVTAYMRRLPREAEPGTRWNYNTGETNLIGVLVQRATGRQLADYLSERVWRRWGMESDGSWLVNESGGAVSGCCLQLRLRDYARFGEFVLADGAGVVPDGWFSAAGRRQADIGEAGAGYGYQWWSYDDGPFAARGIFGQGMFIDPARRLVIVGLGNWPTATDEPRDARRMAFYRAVQRAVDGEGGAAR